MLRTTLALAAIVTLVGCDMVQPAKPAEKAAKSLDGYGDLKFGMSFQDALLATRADLFNPYSLKGCFTDLPIRGCLLLPKDNTTAFRSVDGIPYALGLAFNKFDKLTDIKLQFERETNEDPDQKVSRDDCKSIHERTVDWLYREYGLFENKEDKTSPRTKTSAGNEYVNGTSEKNSFFAIARTQFKDGRDIFLVSHYMVIGDSVSCRIDIGFGDKKEVERWEMSPDERAKTDPKPKAAEETVEEDIGEPMHGDYPDEVEESPSENL